MAEDVSGNGTQPPLEEQPQVGLDGVGQTPPAEASLGSSEPEAVLPEVQNPLSSEVGGLATDSAEVEGSSDPRLVTLEHDKEKAHDMVLEGNSFRTEARDRRAAAEENRKLLQRLEKVMGMPVDTNEQRIAHRTAIQDLMQTIDELKLESDGGKFDIRAKDRLISALGRRELSEGKRAGFNQEIDQLERQAKEYDAVAEKTEEWAGIIHDHPISEAYHATHQDVDFSPLALGQLELRVKDEQVKISLLEEALQHTETTLGVDGLINSRLESLVDNLPDGAFSFRPTRVVKAAYGVQPEKGQESVDEEAVKKWQEWKGLLSNSGTTLGQLSDFYIEAFRVAYINPKRNYANVANSVLEDVRSGRAAA